MTHPLHPLQKLAKLGLYRSDFEHDNCGFGLIVNVDDVASHELIERSILALEHLEHRGAVASDGKSGDGCGLLLKKPYAFFRNLATEHNIKLNKNYAIGLVFSESNNVRKMQACFAKYFTDTPLQIAGWRTVPVNTDVLGKSAKQSLPAILQVFINTPEDMSINESETRLYIIRRQIENALINDPHFYVSTLSTQVITYKGLVTPTNLAVFYSDLGEEELTSSLCVFHQRFSTNTLPQWRLAQPFRYLAHNGEINTLKGNLNWAKARQRQFSNPYLNNIDDILPLINTTGSDSQSLDNMVEALVRLSDMPLYKAIRLLVPPAWQNIKHMDVNLRAFYHYHAMHQEPWDGPAGLVMTDGRYAICALDRNGLRPARWILTKERHLIVASEIGVYDCPAENVAAKGRVAAGELLAIDTQNKELLFSEDIDQRLSAEKPYRKWLNSHLMTIRSNLHDLSHLESPIAGSEISTYKKMFAITNEEQEKVINVLAKTGKEATGSMGDDTPLAILSNKTRPLYDYFRQYFAQVTNPPIDSLRENLVMSLETYFGREENCFVEGVIEANAIMLSSPVLSTSKFQSLLQLNQENYTHIIIDLNYPNSTPWQQTLADIQTKALQAVKEGTVILILSDQNIREQHLPVHALLATGAVHRALLKAGVRSQANIVVATATARDPHHFATLIGYGATAIFPYLAYACINDRFAKEQPTPRHLLKLRKHYRHGINLGLYKIISKMGISTIASYRAAQLFEIIGLNDDVIHLCFTSNDSRIAGIGFTELQQQQQQLAETAWSTSDKVSQGSRYQYHYHGEYHAFNPDVVTALLNATASGQQDDYEKFKTLVNTRPAMSIRDLLPLRQNKAIAIDAVESVATILQRFDSAAMSLGALSPEAHEGLAIAMNRLGGHSNSGEGGEDPARYGTEKNSKIKQIASGRFGVTPAYLMSAEIIQIKMAQGAKPGEGGQLPGHKVNDLIANLRFSKPGIALISPPPHHDIYSIEDLEQLIYDLKQLNNKALVSVKLVAKPGVGTIAAGVAKAGADIITISGYDGGTGASPLTSTNNAGGPWELGISEAHQVLLANGLRQRVRLQADGGLKTGLDVIKSAILGADSFGFGTAPMIAEGCKYLRICHLNNCATGVATQDKRLRKEAFIGTPERVMNYFTFVANEVREYLALLGATNLNDVIGKVENLTLDNATLNKKKLDLSAMLDGYQVCQDSVQYCTNDKPFNNAAGTLNQKIIEDALPYIETQQTIDLGYPIVNTDRAVGARLAGTIIDLQPKINVVDNPVNLHFQGVAGQSFAAWNIPGLNLSLVGEANDYVGKGMHGGKIVIYPAAQQALPSQDIPIIGNACLYGATGGELYAAGRTGERFAVRNSGTIAVVEGVGDHCCEYMTEGTVVVLGKTGVNFGAGMTGGLAYVLDLEHQFVENYNSENILIDRIQAESMEAYGDYLYSLLDKFVTETNSVWGQKILTEFYEFIEHFWLARPIASQIDELINNIKEPL